MKPAPFEYHAPTTLSEVVGLLGELEDAKLLAGGQSLVPLMALRLATVDHIVDLGQVGELRGIGRDDTAIRIGAATTQATLEHDVSVAKDVPLLARSLPHIGHFQIRNRGTIGGSIAHADPASELPAVALTLDARMTVTGSNGEHTLAAAEFFTGTWTTALGPDDVLTAVTFPVWRGRCGFAIEEVTRRHGDFAIAGACVAVELDDRAASIRRSAIGLIGLGPVPRRAAAAEAALVGAPVADVDPVEVGRLAVGDLTSVPSDLNGSADYRVDIGKVVVARALARAIDEARNV